jgi:hypothetical protein
MIAISLDLAGRQFATHANMEQVVTSWIQMLSTDFLGLWDTNLVAMVRQML